MGDHRLAAVPTDNGNFPTELLSVRPGDGDGDAYGDAYAYAYAYGHRERPLE
jgi:hypothetical protein